jgi:CRISPR/Cas system-associated protein Cas5 (RAMP superfamily)
MYKNPSHGFSPSLLYQPTSTLAGSSATAAIQKAGKIAAIKFLSFEENPFIDFWN